MVKLLSFAASFRRTDCRKKDCQQRLSEDYQLKSLSSNRNILWGNDAEVMVKLLSFAASFRRTDCRKKDCQQTDRRKESTDTVNEVDAGAVGQRAEHGRADAAHAESQSKEQARDRAHFAGDQILRVDQNRRECRRQHQSDRHAQYARPEEVGVRKRESERQNSENRPPDDVLAADAVSQGPAYQSAGGGGRQEDEEV